MDVCGYFPPGVRMRITWTNNLLQLSIRHVLGPTGESLRDWRTGTLMYAFSDHFPSATYTDKVVDVPAAMES